MEQNEFMRALLDSANPDRYLVLIGKESVWIEIRQPDRSHLVLWSSSLPLRKCETLAMQELAGSINDTNAILNEFHLWPKD